MRFVPADEQRARLAGGEERLDRVGGEAAAEHRIIDALARCRRDHARGVAGNDHVAAIVPAPERLERDRALPTPTLAVSPCGKIQA